MRSEANALGQWSPGDDAWRRLAENVDEVAIILLDPTGRIASWNRGAERLKGYCAEEIIGQPFSVFYPDEAIAVGHPGRELAAAASIGRYAEEGWRVRKDGTRFWAEVVITTIYDEHGEVEGFGKLTRDLTLVKQAEEQRVRAISLLETTAATDFLTGLPNRRSWDDFLHRELARCDRDGTTICIAILDIDRFKLFNDRLGHREGDRFLKRCAAVWRTVLRPSDFLARYGGEEFVLCLPQRSQHDAAAVVDRLRAATPSEQTCSAGVASWNGTESLDGLFKRADRALYHAKDQGRDRTLIAAPTPAPEPSARPTHAQGTIVDRSA
jgi:diguanylate cyclase (GGDEF)-like protein/PAS domain S-box-containing protein